MIVTEYWYREQLEIVAERDRLRAALEEIADTLEKAKISDSRVTAAVEIARRATAHWSGEIE